QGAPIIQKVRSSDQKRHVLEKLQELAQILESQIEPQEDEISQDSPSLETIYKEKLLANHKGIDAKLTPEDNTSSVTSSEPERLPFGHPGTKSVFPFVGKDHGQSQREKKDRKRSAPFGGGGLPTGDEREKTSSTTPTVESKPIDFS